MRKKIKVERIVIDTYIESLKEIFLEIGLKDEELVNYIGDIFSDNCWKENQDYRVIRNEKGGIIDINCSEPLLTSLLKKMIQDFNLKYIDKSKKMRI